MGEIRAGRGAEFAPAVVDGFLAALSQGGSVQIGETPVEPLKAVA